MKYKLMNINNFPLSRFFNKLFKLYKNKNVLANIAQVYVILLIFYHFFKYWKNFLLCYIIFQILTK